MVTDDVQVVKHLQCTTWPDMDAPAESSVLIKLIEDAEKILDETPGSLPGAMLGTNFNFIVFDND